MYHRLRETTGENIVICYKQVGKIGTAFYVACSLLTVSVTMIEAHIRALEQFTMIALTLFASQSKQIIIKILDLKDILGL